MLLNKGQLEGKRVMREKAVEEMEKAQFAELPVKYVPKAVQGAHYGLGAWILDADAGNKAGVLSCPNLLGTTPYIDTCRQYAAILIVLKPQEDQKKELVQSMKNLIDEAIGASGCN